MLKITVTPRGIALLFLALVMAAAVLLVLTTLASEPALGTSFLMKLGQRFNLGAEDNFGAWFSSMTLLLIAILSSACLAADSGSRSSVGVIAWTLLALVFAGLSLDELGSIHERIPALDGLEGWLVWLLPFVVVVPGFLAWFGYTRLRGKPWSILFLAVSVILFCFVPLQEYFEFVPGFESSAADTPRAAWAVALEEGTELAAMDCVIASLLVFIKVELDRVRTNVLFAAVDTRVVIPVLASIFVLFAVVAYGLAALSPPTALMGNIENWAPSALAFVLAVGALAFSLFAGRHRLYFLAIAVVGLLQSAYIGSNEYVPTPNALATNMPKIALVVLALSSIVLRPAGTGILLPLCSYLLLVAALFVPAAIAPIAFLGSLLFTLVFVGSLGQGDLEQSGDGHAPAQAEQRG